MVLPSFRNLRQIRSWVQQNNIDNNFTVWLCLHKKKQIAYHKSFVYPTQCRRPMKFKTKNSVRSNSRKLELSIVDTIVLRKYIIINIIIIFYWFYYTILTWTKNVRFLKRFKILHNYFFCDILINSNTFKNVNCQL